MSKSVLVYCWRGCNPVKNLGEWYNKIVLEYLGYKIRYFACHRAYPTEPVMLIVGSNFHQTMMNRLLATSEEVRIWGQGNGWGRNHAVDPEDPGDPAQVGKIKVFALRGPLTAQQASIKNVPLCDPGFLLPRALPRKEKCNGVTCYVPHHMDRKNANDHKLQLGVNIYVDVFMPVKEVLATIGLLSHAKFVLTGSLHTMILCLAYGVPCAKYLTPDYNLPEPQRWDDLFASMGAIAPTPVKTLQEGRDWWEETGSKLTLPDSQALLEAFPHYLYSSEKK